MINRNRMRIKRDKKGLEIEQLGIWLIAFGVLVLVLAGIYLLKTGKLGLAIEYIKSLFRFRG
jgi:hypothetical protein